MQQRSRVQGAAWGSVQKTRNHNTTQTTTTPTIIEPKIVNVQAGLVLLKNQLEIETQKWLIDVAFGVGLATDKNKEGFYVENNGRFILNQGTRGRVIKSIQDFPVQFTDLCLRMLDIACAADSTLPRLEPNTVLLNYYNEKAYFKWHKDSEDPDLIKTNKGKPIISFSVGMTAEFLYKVNYEDEKHNTILLSSGDVLVFGGPSRMIVHCINQIYSKTMPGPLLSSTMRSGRLNITVRDIGKGHIDKSQFPKYRVVYNNSDKEPQEE